jgi:hypothetical protein
MVKDCEHFVVFFFCSGFGPIPVEGGESTPTATSSNEELTPSTASAVPTPTPRQKEDLASIPVPSSAAPQKINGETETLSSQHDFNTGLFPAYYDSKYCYFLWCSELVYILPFLPSWLRTDKKVFRV